MTTPAYIIGIDLGTTNCTIAYAPLPQADDRAPPPIAQQPLLQTGNLKAPEALPLLPSFLYIPLPEEHSQGLGSLPWNPSPNHISGHFAKSRGAELPERCIHSAKSWLCHDAIDRRSPLLPIGSQEESIKLSPKACISHLLAHIKASWDNDHPTAPFTCQELYLTVPASFDPSARELVLEAAADAGYSAITLLEEPLAALYNWLLVHTDSWRSQLTPGDLILVADIGGGTSDFSLIRVAEESGNLLLSRVAVGPHLLLGGDNLDHALAHHAKALIEAKHSPLDDWQMRALIYAARTAKETLLSSEQRSSTLVVPGKGTKLIGNALKCTLTSADVSTLLLNGFFPLVTPTDQAAPERRSGLRRLGLPYAQDSRITAQLAKFLSQTGESDTKTTTNFLIPTVILLNGGTLKAPILQNMLLEQINSWASDLGAPPARLLAGADLDFAVSRGAVAFGLTRHGFGLRIRASCPRSYFIGVEDAMPTVPGIKAPITAFCIAPYGMEEGSVLTLPSQEFALLAGETVHFRFFSRTAPLLANNAPAHIGTTIANPAAELTELHPIETTIDIGSSSPTVIPVTLSSRMTELGTLELLLIGPGGKEWQLAFDARKPSELS